MTAGIGRVASRGRTTVVSVCHNSADVLTEMLDSVPSGVPVILIDNASSDVASLSALARERGATLIRNNRNEGFGRACNQGAEAAETEFVLFLNPDAQLLPAALDALVAAADRYPVSPAMNPRFVKEDGSPAFKGRSHLVSRSERMARGWPGTDSPVPVLWGAALFVRRAAFKSVGGFDPEIFLYHEDDDLSVRLKAQVGPLYFVREAAVRHLGGRSTARSPDVAALKGWHMGRSWVYVMLKHGRPLPRLRPLQAALVQLCSPVILISRRKRAKQVAFFRGVCSAIFGSSAYRTRAARERPIGSGGSR